MRNSERFVLEVKIEALITKLDEQQVKSALKEDDLDYLMDELDFLDSFLTKCREDEE